MHEMKYHSPPRLLAPSMRYSNDFSSLEAEWFAANTADYCGEAHPTPVPVPVVKVVHPEKRTLSGFGRDALRLLRMTLLFGLLLAIAIAGGLAVVAFCYETVR
jgi:hypothetical protein